MAAAKLHSSLRAHHTQQGDSREVEVPALFSWPPPRQFLGRELHGKESAQELLLSLVEAGSQRTAVAAVEGGGFTQGSSSPGVSGQTPGKLWMSFGAVTMRKGSVLM